MNHDSPVQSGEKIPRAVRSHDIHLDSAYAEWMHEVKDRYRNAQVKAAVKVNAEQLLFNWELGRDLVERKAEEIWGSGIVEQVSLDLQNEFPKARGFSTRNLWNMKKWYLFYASNEHLKKLQQLVAELEAIPSVKLEQLGRSEVQWAFKGINTPLGVATYENLEIQEMQEYLPTTEQIQERLAVAEQEFFMDVWESRK